MILAIFVAQQALPQPGTVTMSEVMMLGIAGLITNALIVWIVSVRSHAKFEGGVVERLKGIDGEVKELKTSRTDMWKTINKQGKEITAIQTACEINHA